jgi:hypothetical protein
MRLAAGVTAQFHAVGGSCQWGSEGRRTLRRAEWTQWSLEPSEPMDTARPTVPLGNAGGGLRHSDPLASVVIAGNAGISRERCPGCVGRGSIPKSNQALFRKGCGCAVALEPTAEPCEDKRACGLQEWPRLVQSERRLWCAAGGGTKHLGYHSVVQPPLPSCFARLLFLLHSSHAINLPQNSLHTTYIESQHAQGSPCRAVDLHFPSGPFPSASPLINRCRPALGRLSHLSVVSHSFIALIPTKPSHIHIWEQC